MQLNPPVNLAHLNQIFNQYDDDHDGQVNIQQIESILRDVGFADVYIGTIKKIIRLINQQNGLYQKQTLDFLQVQEFAQAMVTKGKFKIWKTTLQYKADIQQMIRQLQIGEQNGAAPGASPTGGSGLKGPNNQQGQISINVGNLPQYPQYFSLFLEKHKGKETNPFLKLIIERNSHDEALQLEATFKSLHDVLIDILKTEEQAMIEEILSVTFDTKVQGTVFTLHITTQNQGLITLVEVFAEALDKLMRSQINGKFQAHYRFDFDFQKFISDPTYNFYDLFTKNSMINVKWNVWDLFNGLRHCALKSKIFDELKWSPSDPFLIFLIGLLNCEKFTGRLEFQNTDSLNQQVDSKKQIAEFFKEAKSSLNEFGESINMDLAQLIQHLEGKLFIEIGVKDWKFRIQTKLSGLEKMFVQDIKDEDNSNE